jgi:hypothetical protein
MGCVDHRHPGACVARPELDDLLDDARSFDDALKTIE